MLSIKTTVIRAPVMA